MTEATGWRADFDYLLACVEAHADKFPVPEHMRELVAKVRAEPSEDAVERVARAICDYNGTCTEPCRGCSRKARAALSASAPPAPDRQITDTLAEIRAAFDGDDVARKNRALRWGSDAITKLLASAPPAAPADELVRVLEREIAENEAQSDWHSGNPSRYAWHESRAAKLREALARHRAQPSDCCKRTLERAAEELRRQYQITDLRSTADVEQAIDAIRNLSTKE